MFGSQIDGARDYQEDAFLVTHLGDSDSDAGSLVIVADGMGGHAAGNVASNMAVQTFNRHISKNYPNEDIANVLYEAVLQANASITATVEETAALKGMGCTLVACVVDQQVLRWVSVGDSHLYLIRDGDLSKKNADHSYGGFLDRMAEAGTPVEAEAGFSRNMLMSALTGDDIAEIDCPPEGLTLEPGDRLILSSDGLDTLPPEDVINISNEADTAKQCTEALLQAVTDAGAPRQDNTTVICIDCSEKIEAAPAEAPAAAEPSADAAALELEAEPAPAPAAVASEAPTFPVEDAPKKSRTPLIAAAVLLLAALGGGAYWFMGQSGSTTTPLASIEAEPAGGEDETSLEELEPVENESLASAEVAPEARPEAPAAAPAPSNQLEGEFKDKLKRGGEGPLMVWLPAGKFSMGSRISTSDPNEHPRHDVTISQFAMSVNEVTIAEYRRFAKATGTKMPNLRNAAGADEANFPMFFVSWNDALAYVKWLSKQSGKNYRLPTESQWEYAARAGSDTAYYWGRKLGRSNAHCFACDTGLDPRRPTAIGRFNPNKFGLYDMAGNIQEWVYDCYHGTYDTAPTDGSVFEGGDCTVRVLRGGGYGSGPKKLRSAARDKLRFDKGNDQTGIRVIRLP